MPNLYDGPLNKHIDFTSAGPAGEPASGLAVQNYIKDIDSKKVGVGYTLEDGSAHLLFADEEDKNTYIADNTREDLIIDRFELEALYTMAVTLLTPTIVPVNLGSVGNIIRYNFETRNKNDQVISEDVIATYTITRGTNVQKVTENYHAGTTVAFNVDKYLLEGVNTISISVKGQTSKIAGVTGVTYQVINLTLTDTMNIGTVYGITAESNMITIPYTVQGVGLKTMEWYIDGEQLDFIRSEDEISDSYSERTKFIPIDGLSQGRHSVQFRVGLEVSGETFYSKTLYRDVLIYGSDMSAPPAIGIATEFPAEIGIFNEQTPVPIYPTQYEPYTLRVAVWNPNGAYENTAEVMSGQDILASIVCLEGDESETTLMFTSSDQTTLSITVDGTSRVIALDVAETTMSIHEITNDLELGFSADGRTNSSSNKDEWSDGTHTATFNNFEWIETSGWSDGKLLIPSGANVTFDYAPLSVDPTTLGKTVEIEFKSINVDDDDAVLLDLMDSNNNCGIKLTATEIQVRSRGGVTVSRRFKTDEDLRISIVINRKTGSTHKGLLFVYFNGILSIAQDFATTDTFTSNKQLTIGGTDSGILLKQLRIYDTALSAESIVNNYILYRDTLAEMLSIYERNDLYQSGTSNFDLEKIARTLPVMIITGDMTPIDTATDNKATTYVDVEYTNLQNPTYSFRMTHATMRPQGTSSLTYPRKNLRLYTRKSDETVVYDYQGNVVSNRLYSFKQGAQPVDCWTLKADFAESSSTHNTSVARIWNDVMRTAQVNGEYVLRTEAQQSAVDNNYPYDVRTTVDGFPIVIFHKATSESPITFLGKYNFNNDKSTESVFGFCDIPGFDDSNVQCWEFRDSGFDLALFKTPSSGRTYSAEFDYYASNYEDLFKQVWESRYPDTSEPSYTALKRLGVWINSTQNNLQKWIDEKEDYFDLPKLAAYYIYLMRFGAVDQTVKNSMITTEDGLHWYFINYDNDTILGVRNDGLLKFGPEIDRQSPDPELGGYAYAGHDSVLWNNFEADTECMELVRTIDSALFTAGLTYNNMINMFNVQQSGKWAENIYNEDASYKYLEPYMYESKNYLGSLQGSRADHRKWWISNRFSLYDAKYVNDSYNNNAITLLVPNAKIGDSFSITAGKDFYYGYGQNRQPVETGVYVQEDQSHEFELSMNFEIGTPLRIYAPHYIKTLDLSGLMQFIGSANFNISAAYSDTLGSKMKNLILGVDNHYTDLRRNNALSALSGLSRIVTLESLNIAGFTAITSLDLSTLTNLKTLKAKASGLTSVTFAAGAPITTLELPATMQALTLRNLTQLTSEGIDLEGNWANVNQIDIRNCQSLSASPDTILDWLDNKTSDDSECSVYMDNVDWTISNENMQKLIDFAKNGGSLTLRGRAEMGTVDSPELAEDLKEVFGANVFSSNAPFYIIAQPSLYIYGPSTIVEGESTQFRATAIGGALGGTYMYRIDSGSRTGTTLNQSTGEFVTTENGNNAVTFVIRVDYVVGGNVITGRHTIEVQKATYASASILYIDGYGRLELGTPQTYEIKYTGTTVYNGKMKATWTLSGDITSYASIISYDDTHCTVALSSLPESAIVTGQLSAAIIKKYTGASITTKSKDVAYQDDTIAIARAVNPYAMDVMYNNGLCANQNYMTKTEAALVTENQLQPGYSYSTSKFYANSNFRNNCNNFDEFQHFTGLTRVPMYLFSYCHLTHIEIPKNINTFEDYSFYSSYSECVIRLQENNSLISLGNEWYTCGNNSSVGRIEGPLYIESLTVLGTHALNGSLISCSQLDNADLVFNNLTKLGFRALANTNIKSVNTNYINFNPYDSSMKEDAFDNCNKLTTVDLSRCNITYIGTDIYYNSGPNRSSIPEQRIFGNCPNLENLIMPSTLVKIGGLRPLSGCTKLKSVYWPSVTQIASDAFYNTGFTDLSGFPNLTSISNYAFINSSFTEIHLPKTVIACFGSFPEHYVVTVDPENETYYSENNTIYKTSDDSLVACSLGSTLKPNISAISGGYCCYNLSSITSFDFSNVTGTIPEYAFYNTGLIRANLPATVTNLGQYSFAYCSNLIEFTLETADRSTTDFTGRGFLDNTAITSIDFSGWNFRRMGTSISAILISGAKNLTYVKGKTRYNSTGYDMSVVGWMVPNMDIDMEYDLINLVSSSYYFTPINPVQDNNTNITINSVKIRNDGNYGGGYLNYPSYTPGGGRTLTINKYVIDSHLKFRNSSILGSYNTVGIKNLVMLHETPPTISSIYSSVPTVDPIKTVWDNMKIWVPQGYGNAYKTASGWNQYADKIFELDANGEIPE